MWLSPSGQVAHTTLDWRLCRTRIFTLFTTLAINHTNTALATENSSTVSEESTTEDESEASTNHEIQPVSDKSPRPMD